MRELSLAETQQIIEPLFKDYIYKIDINGIEWELEFMLHDAPNILLKQLTATEIKRFITGGSLVDLPFVVYYRNKAASINDVIHLSQPLNDLSNFFYKEEQSGFAELKKILPAGITPLELRMTSTPTLEGALQNNTAIFKAVYRLRYRKD